jgi:hypothetical protein
MHQVCRFDEFERAVGQPLALCVAGEVFPFPVEPPSLRDVIDQARREPQARIATGKRGTTLLES